MTQKRILITEVSGECRNLRIQQDPFDDKPGTYCAAYIHGGWEKIDPAACDTCKREKFFTGITRQEAIEKMAKAIHFYEWGHHNHMPKWDELNGDIQTDYRNMAGSALNALLTEVL